MSRTVAPYASTHPHRQGQAAAGRRDITSFIPVSNGIKPGSVAAIIYHDKVVYAVFADEGPSNIIGEASYATARALGINPDPENGGVDSGVTYIVFPGKVPSPIESNGAIDSKGIAAANAFVNG